VRAASPNPAVDPGTPQRVLVMLRLPPEHLRPNTEYGGSYGDGLASGARRRIAERLARAHGLSLVDDWPMPLVGVDCFVLAVPAGQSPAALAASLSADPAVAWSEPMNLYRGQASATHNDPLYPAQPAAREWRLAELHRLATGRNVRVAVIDSRVESAHPDLIGQVAVSQNFVADRSRAPEQHGTAVAGVIAAKADNGLGIAGVAPGARLMALRACWQSGPTATLCDSLSLAKAMSFAITHSAQVINLSLSGPPDILLGKLVDAAQARRIAVVGAFDRHLPGGGFPASHTGVVAVADEAPGAIPTGVYAAPGHDVPTTVPGGRYALVDGASFAAAHVSGLLALTREHGGVEAGQLTLISLRPGGGAIDACATVARADGGDHPCVHKDSAIVSR
jgi:subtilisin family serine protease